MTPTTRSYGAWTSPISAEMVSQAGMSSRGTIRDLWVADGHIYWRELRGDQEGRYDLLHAGHGVEAHSILPREYSVSTKVHEYGGGAFAVHQGVIYFSNARDQRLYRLETGQPPVPLSPEPEHVGALRYADGRGQPQGDWLVFVQEQHKPGVSPLNHLVAVDASGQRAEKIIAAGHDFYANPRFSHDGSQLAFISWDHPNMPWDGTELWLAEVAEAANLTHLVKVAGGTEESIVQPEWGPDGWLYYISDESGWWNLYRHKDDQREQLTHLTADIGTPAWNFGFSRYAFLDSQIAFIYSQDGLDHLALLHLEDGSVEDVETPFTAFYLPYLRSDGKQQLWFLAGSPRQPQALYTFDLDKERLEPLRQPQKMEIDSGYIADMETLTFPTSGAEIAHAFLYPPANPEFTGPEQKLPPLMVMIHGGPTSAAVAQFHMEKQFWTSRGFMVADLNYRGSTGFGRQYRERLKGQWGLVDVDDCVYLARHLVTEGLVDPDMLVIRGSSAGGYVVLAALTNYDDFDAGASYYGVADIEALAKHTHKFEAHYMDSLVGPYPEALDTYRQRSPIEHLDNLSSPLIMFQGSADKVVPPEQALLMVEALEGKGLPYAYLEFEGEGHGFDRESSVVRALTAELYFYSRIFNFDLGEAIEPVQINNL